MVDSLCTLILLCFSQKKHPVETSVTFGHVSSCYDSVLTGQNALV
jgi:hypothetical protein